MSLFEDAQVPKGAFDNRINFFKQLSKEVLRDVRNLSTEFQEAFDKQLRLVPKLKKPC